MRFEARKVTSELGLDKIVFRRFVKEFKDLISERLAHALGVEVIDERYIPQERSEVEIHWRE